MSPRSAQRKEAVETMPKCTARRVEPKPVIELFQGKVACDGVIEAFEHTGYPHTKPCYAGMYVDKGEPQYVTVLERPPVDSAETAVQAAIVAGGK
jgi:hypothetical protein